MRILSLENLARLAIFLLAVAMIIQVMIPDSPTGGLSSVDGSWLEGWGDVGTFIRAHTSYTFWVVVFIILLAAAFKLKGRGSALAWIGVLLVAAYGFHEFINYVGRAVDRGVNYGDWSDSSDHIPTISGGTVKMQRLGEVKQFLLTGEVKIINPVVGTCIGFSPDSRLLKQLSRDGRTNVIAPACGATQLVTIRVKPASQCRSGPQVHQDRTC